MDVLMKHGERTRGLCVSLLLAVATAATLGACSTDAVGVGECRDVEYARCEASVPCGVIEADEVKPCKRFYRDHCLHGIKGSDVPTANQHKECLALIKDAGERAQASLGMGGSGEPDGDACKIVAQPWDSEECAYLTKEDSSMGGSDEN